MNWLEKNPVAVTLAGVCAVLVLISAALIFIWTRPASSGVDTAGNADQYDTPARDPANDLGPISQYKGVTDRPLFEETRRPVVAVEMEDSEGEGLADQEVSGKPEVALSGVVITEDQRIVTLRPAGGGDSIIAQEGQSLGEEYPGWAVTDIEPRKIVLASLDGDSVELDLAINTRTIAEPPKPEPEPPVPADAAGSEGEEPPLSRAEEIRQRIAQRREELRRQAEENEQDESQKMRTQYQSAIQNMIKRNDNNDETGKKNDGDGN